MTRGNERLDQQAVDCFVRPILAERSEVDLGVPSEQEIEVGPEGRGKGGRHRRRMRDTRAPGQPLSEITFRHPSREPLLICRRAPGAPQRAQSPPALRLVYAKPGPAWQDEPAPAAGLLHGTARPAQHTG